MNILMVGGTGTISYDATCFFLQQGHTVYLLNRGNRNSITHQNIKYIIGDANDYTSMQQALSDYIFDVIIDFIIFTPAQMTARMRIYEGKCKQFIFISSATAYKLTDGIYYESSDLGNDKWKYSRDKRECEEYLSDNIKKHSYQYTIIRPYITYDNRRIPFPVITKKLLYSH